jgi:hypothetical protein
MFFEQIKPVFVLFFGPYARGTERENSDLNIAYFSEGYFNKLKKRGVLMNNDVILNKVTTIERCVNRGNKGYDQESDKLKDFQSKYISL